MWELDHKDSWAPKYYAFELWCRRRLWRVPWTERRSNQSILKEISPEYSLARLMLKLKLQYFGHLMGRTDSLKNTLMGKIEGRRRRGWQRMRWLDGTDDHEFEQALGVGDGQGSLACSFTVDENKEMKKDWHIFKKLGLSEQRSIYLSTSPSIHACTHIPGFTLVNTSAYSPYLSPIHLSPTY